MDNDGAQNYLEYLVGSDPRVASERWQIGIRSAGNGAQILFRQIANRGFEVQWTTDLFDPNSWRALDVPDNRPFFSATSHEAVVEDPTRDAPTKFYRVRVFEQ